MVMELVGYGEDPKDDRTRRSHLGLLVTRRVNKIVLLPVLKDHGSAGVTGALKNMSHGLGQQRLPVAQHAGYQRLQPVHPPGRRPPDHPQEVRPAHHGRHQGRVPGRARSLETRVDLGEQRPPVRDRPRGHGPRALAATSTPSARRRDCPRSAASGKSGLDPLGKEGFDIRQPQHIRLAANLGLGIFEFNSPRGRKFSIHHKVIDQA